MFERYKQWKRKVFDVKTNAKLNVKNTVIIKTKTKKKNNYKPFSKFSTFDEKDINKNEKIALIPFWIK